MKNLQLLVGRLPRAGTQHAFFITGAYDSPMATGAVAGPLCMGVSLLLARMQALRVLRRVVGCDAFLYRLTAPTSIVSLNRNPAA